jgi:ERF superfamily
MSNLKNIAAAMILARAKFPPIHKNKSNSHFKNKYASLDSIIEAITPALCEAGILLVQPTIIRDGATILSTQLIHGASGELISSELVIPPQSDPQKLGSALTYYRRFSICSLLSIAADDDDDGSSAVSNINTNASTKPKSVISPPTPIKLASGETARQYQADLKVAFDILGWEPAKKAAWAKSINPLPFAQWEDKDWDMALKKAYVEVDRINEPPNEYLNAMEVVV